MSTESQPINKDWEARFYEKLEAVKYALSNSKEGLGKLALAEYRSELSIRLFQNTSYLSEDILEICYLVTPAPNGFTIDGQFYYGDPVYWLQQYLDAPLSKKLSHFVGRAQTL